MSQDVCEIDGCNNLATHITSTESRFIEVCKDHWYSIYRK